MPDMFEAKPGSYWICFDVPEEEAKKVHAKILTADFIKSWWNQIPRFYVVQSDLDREDFFKSMNAYFDSGKYLMGAFEGAFGGLLSFDQWKHLLNAPPERLRALEIAAEREVERRNNESK